ncbi:MAG: 30S ribosomal protein S8 [Candidatus Jorgensenbacteria bacterium]|nr:30S ribosomal protein S8 [Candidatus Jorgensenbacteria bacterium]
MFIDLLIKIKNAQAAGKKPLKVRYSKMNLAIAELLCAHGFLKKAEVKGKSFKKIIEVDCDVKSPIRGIKFLSKPSVRRYGGYRAMKPVKHGHGIIILSTPKGIMTGEMARRGKVGGELLCEIW